MICYAIWDQTDLIPNAFLRQYIQDTFYEISLDFGTVPIGHDIDALIRSFVDTACDHLVVFHSGHVIRSASRFREAVTALIQQDFLIAGHILHRPDSYPSLHPQCFVLNMHHYRRMQCPLVGHEAHNEWRLHTPERSPENVHDDYTPLWLKPTGQFDLWSTRNFGWNLIDQSLMHELPVLNLPNDVRWAKRYLYPHDQPDRFAECLQQLARDQLVVPPDLNVNQYAYLTELLSPGQGKVFLVNTERLLEDLPVPPINCVVGPASGFKLFVLWHRLGQPREVIYFDNNQNSLKVWIDIVDHWSGSDFESFCGMRNYRGDLSKLPLVYEAVENFTDNWQAFQETRPQFIYCDVLKEPEVLRDALAPNGNLVWYSNCFQFYEGIRRYGIAGCDHKEQEFRQMLLSKAPDTHFIGRSR